MAEQYDIALDTQNDNLTKYKVGEIITLKCTLYDNIYKSHIIITYNSPQEFIVLNMVTADGKEFYKLKRIADDTIGWLVE